MNIIQRFVRLAHSYAGLRGLHARTDAVLDQPEELVSRIFAFAGGALAPIQVEAEFSQLTAEVRRLRPRRVLEIGTSMGGTLYTWTRVAAPDAVIVSLDLPGGKFGGGYSTLRTPLYQSFARPTQKLHLLRADSHDPSSLERVRALLENAPVDFLFIDGDHSYKGVRQDWEMYGPLVRPGGLAAFHDVAMNYEDTEVKRFWDEVKPRYAHREYMLHPRGSYGIGVIDLPARS